MLLTTAEVASRLKVIPQKITSLVRQGILPAQKTLRGHLFKSEDVDQLSKQREEEAQERAQRAQERARREQERAERLKLQIRPPGLLLAAEVALQLQVSNSYVKEAVISGKLPAQQSPTGRLLFRSEDVEEFKAEREKRQKERQLEKQQAVEQKAQLAQQAAERRKQRREQKADIKESVNIKLSEEENQDFTVVVYLLGTQKVNLLRKYVQQAIAQMKENDPEKFAETKKHFIAIWKKQGRSIKTQE